MALQIWLPLNSNLDNQGLAETTITVTGTTSFAAGKIGQGLSCNGSSFWTVSNINLGSSCSIACWTKTSTNNKMSWVLGSDASNKLNLYQSSIYTLNIGDGNNNPYKTDNNSNITCLHDGLWHHFVVTFNSTVSKLYIDGAYAGTAVTFRNPTTTNGVIKIGGGYNGTHTYDWNGMINDFRVYDHCLSPKEVKEISKGLVLHYPLNRGGFGGDNLLSRYVVPGQNGPTSTATSGRTNWLGDYKIKIPATENADTYFRLFTTKQLTANTVYTISCQVDGLLDGSYYNFPLFAQGNTGMGVLQLNHNGLCSLTFTMTYGTQTTATGANGETVYICFMDDISRSLASGQGAITLSNFKLEEGSIATPWIPNSADALYSSMGLNNNIEYDVSGYQNNGTITGVLNYSSNTPKYLVSTLFDGTQRILVNPITSEIKTMSAWVKTTKNKSTSQFVCADNDSRLCISFYNGCIISYLNSGGQSTGSKCTLGSSYIENGWNHIVVITTGTGTRDIYCNGVKLVPANNDYWSGYAGGFFIGARNPSQSMPFYGYISDLRVYTTALSEDDVLELYHTPASIANNGTLMTQGEISEV